MSSAQTKSERSNRRLEAEFQRLAAEWREDCAVISSMSVMVNHPAYQAIIGLGPPVVPLLLRELKREPDHWFAALSTITGDNPVPKASRGKLDEMAQAWLEWGRRQGYSC